MSPVYTYLCHWILSIFWYVRFSSPVHTYVHSRIYFGVHVLYISIFLNIKYSRIWILTIVNREKFIVWVTLPGPLLIVPQQILLFVYHTPLLIILGQHVKVFKLFVIFCLTTRRYIFTVLIEIINQYTSGLLSQQLSQHYTHWFNKKWKRQFKYMYSSSCYTN